MVTNVYVDAFNLYYGALKGTAYKWLDLGRLCRLLLPGYSVHRIRYFTAVVEARPGDPGQQQRQQAYIRALGTIPQLSVHYGSFLTNRVRLPLATPVPGGPRTMEVLRTEEKGSDVNLATHLLIDGFHGDCEAAVVVSNDSDLRAPVDAVRNELGLPVGIVIPNPRVKRSALRGDFYRRLRAGVLAASQFPPRLVDAHGMIRRPPEW